MKVIYILYNYRAPACESYEGVQNSMNNNKGSIYTNCLSFFNFSSLNKGYDVIIMKKLISCNGPNSIIEKYDLIHLSELIKNNGEYTKKEIRSTHNLYKMLIANSFQWQRKEFLKEEYNGK